jgi:flagellar biosynthetic protein FliO
VARITYVALVIVLIACCYAACFAQDAPRGAATNLPPPYSQVEGQGEGFVASARYFLSVLFYLILLSAMIWGVVWLLKRYGGKSSILGALSGMRTSSGRGSMRILETLPMGQGRAIHLVQIGEKVLVVGATPQSLTLIAEIADAKEIEAIRRQSYKASPFAGELAEGEDTYSLAPGDAAASLRGAADMLLEKSRGLRRRKRE